MPDPSNFDATTAILSTWTMTNTVTGLLIDADQLAFAWKFISTDGLTTNSGLDIYLSSGSLIIKNSVGNYQRLLITDTYTMGGQLTLEWFAKEGAGGPAHGTRFKVVTINPLPITDPF